MLHIDDDDDDDTTFILDVPEPKRYWNYNGGEGKFLCVNSFFHFFFAALKILKDGKTNGLFKTSIFIDL